MYASTTKLLATTLLPTDDGCVSRMLRGGTLLGTVLRGRRLSINFAFDSSVSSA